MQDFFVCEIHEVFAILRVSYLKDMRVQYNDHIHAKIKSIEIKTIRSGDSILFNTVAKLCLVISIKL